MKRFGVAPQTHRPTVVFVAPGREGGGARGPGGTRPRERVSTRRKVVTGLPTHRAGPPRTPDTSEDLPGSPTGSDNQSGPSSTCGHPKDRRRPHCGVWRQQVYRHGEMAVSRPLRPRRPSLGRRDNPSSRIRGVRHDLGPKWALTGRTRCRLGAGGRRTRPEDGQR